MKTVKVMANLAFQRSHEKGAALEAVSPHLTVFALYDWRAHNALRERTQVCVRDLGKVQSQILD